VIYLGSAPFEGCSNNGFKVLEDRIEEWTLSGPG
jgi:hypothetical protein